jgi:Na+-driven multidrug efflux pump
MKAVVKRVALTTVIIGTVLTAAVILGRNGLIAFFIDDETVIALGTKIAVISLVTAPIFGLGNLSSVFLQSTEKPMYATIAALLRQGVILLPLSYAGSFLFGLDGLLWSSPLTDALATIIVVALCVSRYKAVMGGAEKPRRKKRPRNFEASKRWLSMYCAANLFLQRAR